MRDLPTGPALLALARDVLFNDLLPLLPPEARLDARLVANGMAIAEREAIAGDEPAEAILRKLQSFYTARREAGEDQEGVLPRFAQDLRVGAFEPCEPLRREARQILWQLTFAKLRLANPRFLAANGFS
jgi:Domain of unknown function (DUF6285)